LWVPRIIATIGHIRAFAAFAAIVAVMTLVLAAWIEPLVWIGLRVVGGVCFAGLFAVAESWISDRTEPKLRGRVLGFYMVCNKTALTISPLLLTVVTIEGPWMFMIVSALCSLGLLPVAGTRSESPAPIQLVTIGLRKLYAITPVGMIGCLVIGLVNGPLLSLVPVYGEGVGLSLVEISLLVPALHFGSLVSQWPLGHLSDQGDRRRIIAALNFAVVALSAALWLGRDLPASVVLSLILLLGAAALSIYAICIAHAGDHVGPEQMVPLVSSLLLVWGLGAMLGPVLAASVMQWLGVHGLFLYVASAALLCAMFTIWRIWRQPPVAEESHTHFVNLPATSPAVAELGMSELDKTNDPARRTSNECAERIKP
jgi:MFS family permease